MSQKKQKLETLLDSYEKILDYWKKYITFKDSLPTGICELPKLLWQKDKMTHEAREQIELDIWEYKPSRKNYLEEYNKFTKHPDWIGEGYWWKMTEEASQQRLLFIEQRIEDIKFKIELINLENQDGNESSDGN